jgi:hypothetical protein
MLCKVIPKQLMPTSKKVKRYETEIKAFGKCFELKILKKEQRLS